MGRGRRPLAPEVHERNGSYKKDPQRENKDRPVADGKRPATPGWFDEMEEAVWIQLCEDLESMGVQASTNREIMIAYATAYAGWVRCRKHLGGNMITVDHNGNIKRHPLMADLHKYRDQMNKILPEFGLTPASRGKLVSMKKDEEENPMTVLLEKLASRN